MAKYGIGEVKSFFGERIQSFRKAAGLTQQDFALLMGTAQTYISDVENGSANPSFEMLIQYAAFFGVEYYELGNPNFSVPTVDQLPASTRRAIAKLKTQQRKAKDTADKTKAANKAEGLPGRAKQLHGLVASGFFKRSRTAKDAFIKLNPGIPKDQVGDHLAEIGKITVTLSQGKFVRLLDKLEPAPGSTAVRFVQKDPSVIKYLDGSAGTKDLAAEEG